MGKFDKQLKYSIRKVSVGAASVVIGAFYLAMGAGVVHAETNTTTDGGASHSSPSPEPETSRPNGLTSSSYGAEPAQNPGVSGKSTESTTPKEKENNETLNAAQPTESSTSTNTRGRRVRRETGDAPTGETSGNSTGTEAPAGASTGNNEALNSALTERKGATVQANQPGINIPKGNENGADDPNAHLSFNDPDHTVTVEEMWKIIQNMPDDFQNNERSYLRNMDTLGNDLRFDKTETNPEGVPLQPGEIREINSFGGWHAINKEGHAGKFAVGKKNDQGYFTGWYKDENGNRQEGGMLGSDALDRIYLHEQALDRRFKYMLMLAKGRTIANKDDKAQDGSTFDIVTANSGENKANLASLPVKDREDILQHAPNIEGFNGIEKTFTAFSTAYGSRLKIEFVTGYISDFEGSKGTYRIVVKAIKKDHSEETVYDHTINRIDGVVENEERYSQGVDLSGVNGVLKKILKGEYDKKVNTLADAKYKEKYPSDRRKDREKLEPLKEEAKQELVKKGDVIYELPFDKDELREDTGKRRGKFKEDLKIEASSYAKVANDLNNVLKRMNDAEVKRNSPIWDTSSEKTLENPNLEKSKDPDRVFKLLDFVLPTAKKIIYHADTDQLELQTDPEKVTKHREELKNRLAAKEAELNTANEEKKIELKKEISALKSAIGSTNAYTYTEARNGSKEAKILGSFMKDKTKPDSTEIPDAEYGKYHTNELAEKESDGLAKFTRYFVEKNNVTRSNVLADDKLSEKITTAIEGDQDKLGKGGYFSTGDIPLGKDVVSYKVQVFAENEKRVGVNKQSPRLQYNLPILADFSVIQDTVEPSKELARRIISKSNLPEDKKKEIIEKINKSKKTSEIRSQLSGDVKVKYQDVSGNVLTLDNTKEHQKETDLGKKGEDGTYLAVDSGLRYTNYNVTDKKLNTITTSDGKQYILKRSLEDGTLDNGRLRTSADESGTLSDSLATVTFVYEEYTPPATGKGLVHFKKQVSETTTEALTGYDDITLSGNVGETFSSTEVDTKITELKNAGYEIVSNEFATNSKTIDSTTDEDGQDPSQVYNVVVREKVETVTTPPTPNTPVDPNVPEGPKWPAEGLKESDLTKEVTRTINYFKKETADGEKIADAQPTKVDTVLYKRTATYNLVSKTVTYSNWTPTADDTHTATSFSPVKTPVLTGYVADFKEVTDAPDAPTANGEVTNMTKEVVYTKLGSWVPKIPGKDSTPIPYPNDPKDPTKPKYPDYPKTPENPDETPVNPGGSTPGGETPGTPGGGNETPGSETPGTPEKPKTPELPVIPYEPGYTPGIPTDPTQPVDPKDNPLVPLKLVDPKNPKKGYKVPEIPEKPGKDTPITYVANPQKALVKVVKVEGEGENKTETPLTGDYVNINGKTGEEIPDDSVTDKIADLEKRGYIIENKDDVLNFIKEKFDKDKDTEGQDPTQTVTLKVHEKVVTVTEPPTPNTPIDPENPNGPKWTEELVNQLSLKKDVTRTITYVKKDTPNGEEIPNAKPTVTQTAHFKRNVKVNVVTGTVVEYTDWTSTDNNLAEVPTEKLDGYVADKASVEGVETSVDSTDLDKKVVYTKLGSWVPNKPGGETPTPIPYPNHPTDPTKPGTPVYPEPGQPITPGTPVIPYEPGYTPGIPTDPTQPVDPKTNPLVPLQPVDPNNPGNGYKVPPVPTKPGEDTPITYEKVPNTPNPEQPETTGTKEVTRTIKYVDEKGNELAKPSTDKVTFTGNGSDWNAVGGDSTFDAVKSPVVKGYILKDPDQKVVEKETVKSDAKDETITVTYTKVGSFVPKVPEGVTPKTPLTPTPYDNDPEDPTKVVTPNPEKPQDPKDPNSPKVPVIPQVPGHTPVVPKDPTKPVSPENPLVPLTPVDPNHPEKGYNVPPVPTIPGQDTPITYVKDGQQKAITSFVDPKGNVLETPITETGDSNTPLTKNGEVEATIAKLKLKGYDVETNTYPPTGTFDNDPNVDQYFKVRLTPRVKPVKPFDPTNPKDPNKPVPGKPIDPDTPVDPNNPNDPTIPRWTDELIKKLDVKKEVTRTINYVDEAGNKVSEPSTDKVTFTREAKINVVTGEITYGDWKAVGGDSTFDKVSSPVVKGYILKDPAQKEVAERKGITPTVANQTIEVVYKKLGSWVPKVPGVETPTPLPYPNHPTDPTKPGDPTDPTTPNVPVIPYVPGYTPKTPDGNPLVPVDPNHPENGYKVPPVPTKPGEDTPIEYVKVPNTPSPEEPVKPTPESNHITIWVDENGKPLKPEKPGTHEPGNIPGYRYITTVTKDGVTIHRFEKITPVEPNNPVPQKPTTPIPTPQDSTIPTPESQIPTPNTPEATTPTSETNRREELPNTGTEANASLASAGIMTLLAGLGLGFFKKKEEDESE